MPDVILRDELFESERWLSLPSDTHRLAFISLLPKCDGVGNLKGGQRRIWRMLRDSCHVKTPTESTKLMSELADADLIRRYEADGSEFWHIPRFGNTRRYVTKLWPWSPWNDQKVPLSKDKYQEKQKDAENPVTVLSQHGYSPALGVGVGVGVGDGKSTVRQGPTPSVDNSKKTKPKNTHREDAKQILEYLNGITKRNFRPVDETLKPIMARLKAGATMPQCYAVIGDKWEQWGADDRMSEFVRPKTLFSATNFEQYLGAIAQENES